MSLEGTIRFGAYVLKDSAEVRKGIEGETIGKSASIATQHLFDLMAPDRLTARIAYVTWSNGEREVRPIARSQWGEDKEFPDGNQSLYEQFIDRERLRLQITPAFTDGQDYVALRQARAAAYSRPQLFSAGREDLDGGAGLDCESVLRTAGATCFGTLQELWGETGRSRNLLGACFPRDLRLVPVLAFALTRMLPIMNGMSSEKAVP